MSDYSESVMNAFLLKLAIDHLAEIATLDNDTQLAQQMSELSKRLQTAFRNMPGKKTSLPVFL